MGSLGRIALLSLLVFLSGGGDVARADCRTYLAHVLERPGYFFSQNDPELMRVYANADYLCGPTCVANAIRLADLVSPGTRGKVPFGIRELRSYIDSFSELGIAIGDGTVSFDLATAMGKFSKATRDSLEIELISTYPMSGSPKKLRKSTPWLKVLGKRKILPSLVSDADYDFFIFGYLGINRRGKTSDVGHFTIGVYDPSIEKIRMLDPTHPNASELYSLESKPGPDGQLRISRLDFDEKTKSDVKREYVADEIFGFRLKKPLKSVRVSAGAPNPLLDPNHAMGQVFAPFLSCTCTRQAGIPVCYRGANQLTLAEVLEMKAKAKSIHRHLKPHPTIPDSFIVDGRAEWVVSADNVDALVAAADRI